MPQLHVKSGSRAAQRIELLPGVIRLGRNPTNDYSFEDATVSARHCEVTMEDGAVRVSDMGSTNGVEHNGQRISRSSRSSKLKLKITRLPRRPWNAGIAARHSVISASTRSDASGARP